MTSTQAWEIFRPPKDANENLLVLTVRIVHLPRYCATVQHDLQFDKKSSVSPRYAARIEISAPCLECFPARLGHFGARSMGLPGPKMEVASRSKA